MKKLLLFILFFIVLSSDSLSLNAKNDNVKYKLVFSDEFNLPDGSQPDSTKWSRAERNPSSWARWISNSKDVVYVKKGRLVCRAIPNTKEKGDTVKMLTGAILSKNKFAFKYGKVEVRMKTNQLQGNFPSVWMGRQLNAGEKSPYGEIDIVEMFGTKRESVHTIHSQYTLDTPRHGLRTSFRKSLDTTKWHIYGIEWTAQYVKWTVDGETVGIFVKPTEEELLVQHAWVFDIPYFLLINQSVGEGHHELVPQLDETYETQFDWIRVYQSVES